MKIAAIQLNSQPDLEHNMEAVYKSVKKVAKKGANLVALPENFAFMGNEKKRLEQADKISKTVEESLSEWAKEFEIYLLGGGYPVPAENGKVFNRAKMINPKGEDIAIYNKIHLFDVELSEKETYRESDMVQSGKDIVITNLPEFEMKIGLSICYDVRFPELYRQMTKEGAHILFVPAAFTKPTGKAHWEILLRARAIENSAFVVAPAQTGSHGKKRKTHGHAMIIDPWGKILSNAGVKPGMAMAELDMETLKDVRRKLPSLEHRVL
ncbi:carbon-nitrogen hydrolase family protein [Rhodohalobacter sp. 614A]|uniref:carbon-nitrogen hydrolase family protein n=1 Tax=Rhodohalobacter sp. 614A TaxID=2908649 RepID=UPI00351CCDB9